MRGARPELRIVDEQDAMLHLEKDAVPEAVFLQDSKSGSCSAGSSRQVDDLIEPPTSLPLDIAAEWRRIVSDLRDRRLWKDSMGGLVTSYVLAQATALRLELQIATEGASVPGAGGALKPHPATGLLRSSRETVARLGAELGLTPTARSRKALQPAAPTRDLFNAHEWDL